VYCPWGLIHSLLLSEIDLIYVKRISGDGEVIDISHGVQFSYQVKIYVSDYE